MLSIYRLPYKLAGERVIKVIRRDVFILVKKIAFSALLIVLPATLLIIVLIYYPNLFKGPLSYPTLVLSTSAYYLFVWLFFFFSFIDYYLDVWIITNERIIDVEQRGFFSRTIAEHKLFRIQDVTSEVHGVFPTMLKYGDVHIQTAGTKQRFRFHEIPDPDKVRHIIIKLVERSRVKHKLDS